MKKTPNEKVEKSTMFEVTLRKYRYLLLQALGTKLDSRLRPMERTRRWN